MKKKGLIKFILFIGLCFFYVPSFWGLEYNIYLSETASELDKEMYEAICSQNMPGCEVMLKKGYNVNKKIEVITDVIITNINNEKELSSRYHDFVTPLYIALFNRYKNVAEFLVNNGADVNAELHTEVESDFRPGKSFRRRSTWKLLFHFQDDLKVLRWLLEHGADPNVTDVNGRTMIFYESLINSNSCQLLIDHGANLNIRDNDGVSPLGFLDKNRNSSPYNKSSYSSLILKLNNYEHFGCIESSLSDDYHTGNADYNEKLLKGYGAKR